jgi:hypothetical protein
MKFRSLFLFHRFFFLFQDPQDSFSTEPILEILKNLNKVPEEFRTAIKNNGGG